MTTQQALNELITAAYKQVSRQLGFRRWRKVKAEILRERKREDKNSKGITHSPHGFDYFYDLPEEELVGGRVI